MTTAPLFTSDDIDLLRAGERWLIPEGCDFLAAHFGGLADRIQQYLDQQTVETLEHRRRQFFEERIATINAEWIAHAQAQQTVWTHGPGQPLTITTVEKP